MKESFLNELIEFSNRALKMRINRMDIISILHFEYECNMLHFSFHCKNSNYLQHTLGEANNVQINIILRNLENAINTNCGNNIDLNKIVISEEFDYSIKRLDNDEWDISKCYDFYIVPKNEVEFKKMWLKCFHDKLKEIYTAIRYNLGLPENESILKHTPSQLEEPQPIEEVETENTTHPIYDANLWNKEAFKFFKYLYDNYYLDGKPTNVKLASIWHYLTDIKYDDKINEPTYNLHATKDQYKDFIEKEYRIKITNMDKKDSYNKTHRPIIDNHLKKYEET